MSLKARIRNLAKERHTTAQVLLQSYMFECFLERLSLSVHRDKFVVKGGVLVAAMVGLGNRSTMDLDTTLRQMPLTEETIRSALREICSVSLGDDVRFEVGAINPIRPDDVYGGYNVGLTASYDTIETPLSIDITTGDVITPNAVELILRGIFDKDKGIDLWAYNIETVLAEKVETILRRGVLNTRPRDFYDIAILSRTQTFDAHILREAIVATAAHRGTSERIADTGAILGVIEKSKELQEMWGKYQRQFDYAADFTWEMIMSTLRELIETAGL
jgi:predicted nucleotidyltransferase component of viral defense system